jgi:hypothetical protein
MLSINPYSGFRAFLKRFLEMRIYNLRQGPLSMHNFTLAGSFDTGLTTTGIGLQIVLDRPSWTTYAIERGNFLENKKPA